MSDYRYVCKKEVKETKKETIKIIQLVQDEIRDKFTFSFEFIGSEKRNMVTKDWSSNIGYDLDVNIRVNDDEEEYSAKEIKKILMNAFNKYAWRYGYSYAEDSTRVFTIRVKDRINSRILHSVDFAVVNDYGDGKQEYIRYNKKQRLYVWTEQGKGFYKLDKKEKWCRKNGLWDEVLDRYIDNKNNNIDVNKKSRSIYAETISQICNENRFHNK